MPFRIAIIGCGWVARFGHGPSFVRYASRHNDVILQACCDTDKKKASSFSNEFSFGKAYTDYIRMIEDNVPDAICLCVPEKSTAGIAIKLIERSGHFQSRIS